MSSFIETSYGDRLKAAYDAEVKRQSETVELIASENFVSDDVLKALGSCFTNKYSEGYPAIRHDGVGRKGRYYGGCEFIDNVEELCCELWQQVFDTDYHVNVQPHSGSQANFAAYMAVMEPFKDEILSMSLDNGGHLSHGSPVNFSGKMYKVSSYSVDENGLIDYGSIGSQIKMCHPKVVLAGASAYSRIIDFKLIRQIIDECSTDEYRPYFMVDMSHIAGLVAAGCHQSPFGYADIVTTTTHKTLRGPRGGLIFCKPELADKIDSAVFPGTQGGPLQNVILAKAVCALEALRPEYDKYIHRVVWNASAMANEFINMGYKVVSDGTDNHLFLLDFSTTHPNLTGKQVQDYLDTKGITVNKNCVPKETRSPFQTSGIRIGTPAMTTKGWGITEFISCAHVIDGYLKELNAL